MKKSASKNMAKHVKMGGKGKSMPARGMAMKSRDATPNPYSDRMSKSREKRLTGKAM